MFRCQAAWIEEVGEKGMQSYFIPPKISNPFTNVISKGPGAWTVPDERGCSTIGQPPFINEYVCMLYISSTFSQTKLKEI